MGRPAGWMGDSWGRSYGNVPKTKRFFGIFFFAICRKKFSCGHCGELSRGRRKKDRARVRVAEKRQSGRQDGCQRDAVVDRDSGGKEKKRSDKSYIRL